MKFIAEQSELEDKLSKVSGAVATKDTMPILKGVYISNELVLATDLEIGIKTSFECETENEGKAIFPSRIFSIVKELPDGEIEINVDENYKAELKCNGIEIELDCYDAEEYPSMPEVEEPNIINVNSYQLEKAIQNTNNSVASDEGQPALTGIYFDKNNTVSTNTYRLAKFKNKIGFDDDFILPSKAANEVESLCQTVAEIDIEYSDNYVKFNFGDTTLFSRLIEGEFPNYNQVLPDKSNTKITIDSKDFKGCLKRAKTVDKEASIISLTTDNNSLNVILKSDTSQFEEVLKANVEGDNQTINLDIAYLLDGVKLVEGEKTEIELIDSLSPAVIKEEDLTYLVMPIRNN